MFCGLLHRPPGSRVAAKTADPPPRRPSLAPVHTTTAFLAVATTSGSPSPRVAMRVTGGIQPPPGRRLATWMPSGRPPCQTATASPLGVTAIWGGADSRPLGARVTALVQVGAALAAAGTPAIATTAEM